MTKFGMVAQVGRRIGLFVGVSVLKFFETLLAAKLFDIERRNLVR